MTPDGMEAAWGDTVTFRYRLSTPGGEEIENTFNAEPVTAVLGDNEMATTLQRCIVGLPVGERHVFMLEPWEAFGMSDPSMIHKIPLSEFPEHMRRAQNIVAFTLPNGATMNGLVVEVADDHAVVDFNHPLSDLAVHFEVELLAIEPA